MAAGAKVFAARGYHAARVDDVVKAAKTSHGTFYLYFSSKEDLFRALATEVAQAMVGLARDLPVLTDDGASFAALNDWLERFDRLYAKHGPVIRSWTEAEIVDSEMGKIGGDLVAQFSEELAARLHTAAPELDARIAALALVGMIERSSYYVEARQVDVERAEMVALLARVLYGAVFGAAAATQDGPTPAISPETV